MTKADCQWLPAFSNDIQLISYEKNITMTGLIVVLTQLMIGLLCSLLENKSTLKTFLSKEAAGATQQETDYSLGLNMVCQLRP